MTLGDHLGSHQNFHLAFFPLAQNAFLGSPPAGCVTIHAADPSAGEKAQKLFLQLFGSKANARKGRVFTFGAVISLRLAKTTVVTENTVLLLVQGQADTAMGTPEDKSTEAALEKVGKSAAV
jgi:hypothetical protein